MFMVIRAIPLTRQQHAYTSGRRYTLTPICPATSRAHRVHPPLSPPNTLCRRHLHPHPPPRPVSQPFGRSATRVFHLEAFRSFELPTRESCNLVVGQAFLQSRNKRVTGGQGRAGILPELGSRSLPTAAEFFRAPRKERSAEIRGEASRCTMIYLLNNQGKSTSINIERLYRVNYSVSSIIIHEDLPRSLLGELFYFR